MMEIDVTEIWQKLARRIDEVNRANGWEVPTFETVPVKAMLTVTELSEALDGATGQGADPVGEELADVAIRVIHMLEGAWPGKWNIRLAPPDPRMKWECIERQLWPILRHLCVAVETWRHDNETDTKIALELALRETIRAADAMGVNLIVEVDAKVEKNAQRGHLHGKARAAG